MIYDLAEYVPSRRHKPCRKRCYLNCLVRSPVLARRVASPGEHHRPSHALLTSSTAACRGDTMTVLASIPRYLTWREGMSDRRLIHVGSRRIIRWCVVRRYGHKGPARLHHRVMLLSHGHRLLGGSGRCMILGTTCGGRALVGGRGRKVSVESAGLVRCRAQERASCGGLTLPVEEAKCTRLETFAFQTVLLQSIPSKYVRFNRRDTIKH